MESVRKIIVDSRYFVAGDASSGVYELPEIVEIYGTQALYLEQMSLMNTWFSIDDTNNQFYVIEWEYGAQGQTISNKFQPRIITIPAAPYDINSFAAVLQAQLNGPDKFIKGQYVVSRTSTDPTTGVTSVALAQNFSILITNSPHGVNELFFPVPEKYLRDPSWYQNYWEYWLDQNPPNKPTYSVENPRSICNVLEFPWKHDTWGEPAPPANFGTVMSSSFVDLRRAHAIYLHSLDIGNMSSMAPRGIRTCIAVIPVTQGYGGITVWLGNWNVNDFMEPATRTLKRLSFEIKTARGDPINLQGGHWTAVFAIGPRPV